ncbi:MAG: hypothetical protein HYS08_01250 [Chlamydiae bacterium]|nr:hypothetical protein [Chlamydiota bacterium]MBI3266868.1 hypothetical protein [Chlamydiota bacterium]
MKNFYLVKPLAFSKIILFFTDGLVCALSFYFSKCLFDIMGPLLAVPSISSEVLQYFGENATLFLSLYALLNYFISGLKVIFGYPQELGWFSLGLSSAFYMVGVTLWMMGHPFTLGAFFVFLFFALWAVTIIWRLWALKGFSILTKRIFWNRELSPSLQINVSRIHAYFDQKPSAPFIITFLILLGCCSFLLSFKREWLAEKLASGAYFVLGIGVLIELVQTIRHSDEDDRNSL